MNFSDNTSTFFTRYAPYILLLAFAGLIAYGHLAFNPILTGDDWQAYQHTFFQYEWVIGLGRWGQWLTWRVVGDNYFAPPFTLSLWFCLSLVSVWFQAKTIGLRKDFSLFAYAAMFLFIPFWAETVNFKMFHVTGGVAVLTSALYGYFAWCGIDRIFEQRKVIGAGYLLLAALFLCLTAAAYQPMIFIGVITFITGVLYRQTTLDRETPKRILIRIALMGAVTVVGIGLYIFSVQITQAISGIEPVTTGPYALRESLIASTEDLQFTTQRFFEYFGHYLFHAQHYFPAAAKYLFLALLVTLVVMLVWQRRSITHTLFVITVLGFVIILPWTLGIIRTPDNSYRHNALLGNAAVYGVIVALALDYARPVWLKRVIGGAFVLLLLIFLFQHSAARHITYQINERDMAIVNRIVDRVEAHPRFGEFQRMGIVTIGDPQVLTNRPFAPIPTEGPMRSSIATCGIFNCQILRLPWAMRLVQYGTVQYYPLPWDRVPDERKPALEAIIADMPVWPQPGSIEITDRGEVLIIFSVE